jgi:hypothetical protein
MNQREMIQRRLVSQGLTGPQFETVEQVIESMVAMQAQERVVAPWSLGQRTRDAVASDVQDALANGSILRTHVLRPTWHYVSNADARWLLELSAPRVHGLNRPYYRKFELDAALLAKCCQIMARALDGSRHQTRIELQQVLDAAGVSASGLRLGYILMYAELERVICSGPPRGKHHTYALFDERVPSGPALSQDESLAALAEKFFTSRGPATVKDYCAWSSLTMKQATHGLEQAKDKLELRQVDGLNYWMPSESQPASTGGHQIDLLQGYDELIMSYSETRPVHAPRDIRNMPTGVRPFLHVVILDGQFAGRWQRQARSKDVVLELQIPARLIRTRAMPLTRAVERYQQFLGVPIQMKYPGATTV